LTVDFWQAVLYVHLLAMAFFVGGQLVIASVLVPVERSSPDNERMRAAGRRFGIGSAVALAVLLATGASMASHFGLWGSDTLRIKLTLVGVLILLTLAHLRYPRLHALQAAIFLVSLVVVWLGVDLAG
jgi:uncharacterized membrane protein